jgi:hypothetical protein
MATGRDTFLCRLLCWGRVKSELDLVEGSFTAIFALRKLCPLRSGVDWVRTIGSILPGAFTAARRGRSAAARQDQQEKHL